MSRSKFDDMTKKELYALAVSRSLDVKTAMRKDQMIEVLRSRKKRSSSGSKVAKKAVAAPKRSDDTLLVWQIIKELKGKKKDEDGRQIMVKFGVTTREKLNKLKDEYIEAVTTLRIAIDNTQLGKDSLNDGSYINGRFVSFGSDDTYSDFLDYLMHQGEAVVKKAIKEPESVLPPKTWAHFKKFTYRGQGEWIPKSLQTVSLYGLIKGYEMDGM